MFHYIAFRVPSSSLWVHAGAAPAHVVGIIGYLPSRPEFAQASYQLTYGHIWGPTWYLQMPNTWKWHS